MRLQESLRWAAAEFARAGVPSPEVDAKLIAAELLGIGVPELFFHLQAPTPAGFKEMVARRCTREPLQHILGRAPIAGIELAIGPGAFIPRPETEVLIDLALREIKGKHISEIVDLCSGPGTLALSLAHAAPHTHITGVEIDSRAAQWAKKNRAALGLDERVELLLGDATDPATFPEELFGKVEMVVSNPPYVPENPNLEAEVYFDPHHAVFGGEDGMALIPGIIDIAAKLLVPGGWFGMEHDESTAEHCRNLAEKNFSQVHTLNDLTGRPRFLIARSKL